MNEDTVEKKKIELSTTQIAGSALAAMSGAFFASWAGTAGTLVGAAVGSVIATVGAATYTYSLRRTSAAVRRTAAQVRATALVGSPARSTMVGPFPAADQDEAAAASLLSEPVEPPRRWNLPRNLPWARLALLSVGIMLVALAGLTAVEAVTGQPVSAYTGGGGGHGTTLGHAVGADHPTTTTTRSKRSTHGTGTSSSTTPTPTPTPSTTPTTPAAPTPTPSPTPSPGSVVPSPTPTLPPGTPTP